MVMVVCSKSNSGCDGIASRCRLCGRSGLVIWWLSVTVMFVLGTTPAVFAELATVQEMEHVSRNYLTQMVHKQGSWAGSTDPEVSGVHEIRQDGRLLARYYDVSPRGYVVVPVLKEMSPVKMYSDRSNLGVEQEGGMLQLLRDVLSSRLEAYEATYGSLAAVQPASGGVVFDRSHKAAWDRLAVSAKDFRVDQSLGTMDEAGPLLTSSWHQRAPYNDLCPMGDGDRCVVGCVATSASQIMDFWEWPASGVGDHQYYWNGDGCNGGYVPGQTLSADFSDEYDWANIPDSCDGTEGCTPEQEAALAELCSEVGISLNMGYSACGSGTSMAMSIFPTYFKYSPSITREYRSDHTQQSYFEVIQGEINVGRVMWYGIHSHAIVCDGWRDQGGGQLEMHLNYGWGQENNAWYVMDNLYCGWVEGDICPYNIEHITTHIQPQYDPILAYLGRTLDDSDGDGLAEAGETISIDVTVRNDGNDAAGVAGTLGTDDPYVTITTTAADFGAVAGWGTEGGTQTPFVLEIDPACPNPHVAALELQITADGGDPVTETFHLFIGDIPGFADDTEGGEGHWTHHAHTGTYVDEWHMETYRAHSGASSWKQGGVGSAFHANLCDGALITPPFLLPPDGDLSFYHWISAETGSSTTAWDGGIVMISSGDGLWTQISPGGGYPYTIIDNEASPFSPYTPCYSGANGWARETFDLAAYSGVVQIMFRFGADGATTYEGWYIDDVWVGNTLVGSDVSVCPAAYAVLTFDLVTAPGITTLATSDTGPEPPEGFIPVPVSPPAYYEISTTASFEGLIEVCFLYEDSDIPDGQSEDRLTLQHYEGDQWLDITTLLDTESNLIYGATSSLSPFLLAVEEPSCCQGWVGDANNDGGDEPTIGDITTMIDAKFVTGTCDGVIECIAEADVNLSGTLVNPPLDCDDITIGDITKLIDYLFVTGKDNWDEGYGLGNLPPCP